MKKELIFLGFILVFASCKKDNIIPIIKPQPYLPAFPGSYWTYSNGDRTVVQDDYVVHSYQPDINSPAYTAEKRVPKIDDKFLYGYEITQNSTNHPLKKLLEETVGSAWEVNNINGDEIMRQTIQVLDTVRLEFTPKEHAKDSTYRNVVVVVEFIKRLGNANWNIKEYYAKGVGLIKSEIDNPYDTLPAIVEKKLVSYKIGD